MSTCAYRWTDCTPMLEVASHLIREAISSHPSSKEEQLDQKEKISWIPEEIQKQVIETYKEGQKN